MSLTEGAVREPPLHVMRGSAQTRRQSAIQGRTSPAEEKAGQISKSPEQSENVIENKGSAAEGVRDEGCG